METRSDRAPPLFAFEDAARPEKQVRIVEYAGSGFEIQAAVLGLIDPVFVRIPFEAHRGTKCITARAKLTHV